MHSHLLAVADAVSGGIIGMQDDVGWTAEEAQRCIELAALTARNVAQRARLADRRLIGAAGRGPEFQQLRWRQLPSAHPLDMPVHPAAGKLERLCHETGSRELIKVTACAGHERSEHGIVSAGC